jgi:hypothetical protein
MNRQQIGRRIVLGAVTVVLAVPGLGAAAPVGTGGGVTSPLLGIDRASLPEAVPHLAAPAPDRNQDQPASKHGKHGKKHGHRGKHHKQ